MFYPRHPRITYGLSTLSSGYMYVTRGAKCGKIVYPCYPKWQNMLSKKAKCFIHIIPGTNAVYPRYPWC